MPGRSPSQSGLDLPESQRLSAHRTAKPRNESAAFNQTTPLGVNSVAAVHTRDVPSVHTSFIHRFGKVKIAIASDHAGYEEKELLKFLLDELGVQYEDLGTVSIRETEQAELAHRAPN